MSLIIMYQMIFNTRFILGNCILINIVTYEGILLNPNTACHLLYIYLYILHLYLYF